MEQIEGEEEKRKYNRVEKECERELSKIMRRQTNKQRRNERMR